MVFNSLGMLNNGRFLHFFSELFAHYEQNTYVCNVINKEGPPRGIQTTIFLTN